MMQSTRRERMIEHLHGNAVLRVEEAVQLFSASPATVRRDFKSLAELGMAQRVHGGVRLCKPAPWEMQPFQVREVLHAREKHAIAERAAKLLRPGDVFMVDGGTTTSMLGGCIPDFPLRLITNSVRLASILEDRHAGHSRLEIYLTGGILYPHSGLLVGPTAKASLAQYHAQWAFLSVGGIDETGLSNTNEMVMENERVMISSAETVVVLADHSKIGKRAMCSVAGLGDIDILLTDECPEDEPVLRRIEEAGVRLITVKLEFSEPGAAAPSGRA